MPIVNRVADLQPDIQAWRRDIHENPELLYDVHRTAAFVADRLREFGPYFDSKGVAVTPNAVSEPYMEKGDFIRFREFGVNYTLPPGLAARLRAQRATITVGGRNLKLWTKYKGYDPEVLADNGSSDPSAQFGTSDFFGLPPSRRFFLRMNFDF